ncbi:transporter [Clostridium felsineum]|uniref:YkvI family membrane protein n=1 Tax=Clostridium felsineum TaxID=36839 RepID=UPI00214D4887|nr:transporter [Clostridium felsineum]MCR3760826.1 transporter [Clostridium felsineum]
MIKNLKIILLIANVFIGTIVGAGLASGQEIFQFFSSYGYNSFFGLALCTIIYIMIGFVILTLGKKFKLHSYNDIISIVSPGILGKVINLLTSFFMVMSCSIILAGSGSLLNQYFNLPKWIGILLMIVISVIITLKNTDGLIKVNSLIVPLLIVVIVTIFSLYLFSYKTFLYNPLPLKKGSWLLSSLLYGGFNILCCSGVLVPLSSERDFSLKNLFLGVCLGSIILTIISGMINFLLISNIPYIFKYEIPLLYVASGFSKVIQIALLLIIWCEMLSTAVSDIYSIAKSLESLFKFSYFKSLIIILIIVLPVSQVGFKNLITYLYPAFGCIGIIFMIQCTYFYLKH